MDSTNPSFYRNQYSLVAAGASAANAYYPYYDPPGYAATNGWRDTTGRIQRSPVINPAERTLVLIVAGQSWSTNVLPSMYWPVNGDAIDNLNIYDGKLYSIAGPLLGTSYQATLPLGPGNVAVRVADLLISNGKFDRVILAVVAVGGSTISHWGDDVPAGIYANRVPVIMRVLAGYGIVPGTPGVSFACNMQDGIQDYVNGTSQSAWAASGALFIARIRAAGFIGPIYVSLESLTGQTSNAIRSAQASLWNGTTVFSGGNDDDPAIEVNVTGHPSDAGGATLASIRYNALAASGMLF